MGLDVFFRCYVVVVVVAVAVAVAVVVAVVVVVVAVAVAVAVAAVGVVVVVVVDFHNLLSSKNCTQLKITIQNCTYMSCLSTTC